MCGDVQADRGDGDAGHSREGTHGVLPFAVFAVGHFIRNIAGDEDHGHEGDPREGSPDAHRFQGQVVHFRQVQGQPGQEDVHDVVDDHELNADGPELGRAEEFAPRGDAFLFTGSGAAFGDMSVFGFVDVGAVSRVIVGVFVPYPGQDDADEAEDDEYGVPAHGGHEGDCNGRADDGAEEGAHEDGRAGLALFTGIKPAEGRCSQGREDRAFAHAEEQADGGEADLAFGKGCQSRED